MPARLFRVSFTGEIGFEVNVPAPLGRKLWEILWEAGQQYGITPYGTETMHVLRAEKGYIHVGADTDATTMPDDIGFGQIVRNRREDFVGRRSLSTAEATRADRWQLIGLDSVQPARLIPVGAQCLPRSGAQPPVRPCGRVTSSYFSPTLNRSIAMALIENGAQRMGETLAFPLADKVVKAKVVSPVFYDKEGARQNG